MKAILKLLFLLLLILGGVVITGVLLPTEMRVAVSKEIKASPDIIFSQINTIRNWEKWSPWQKKDPELKIEYEGITGQGASMDWESKVFGNCKVILTHSEPCESVAASFHFDSKSKSSFVWFIEPINESTIVNWTFTITELSLWEKYFALFFRREIKSLFSIGLTQLKSSSEKLKYSRLGEIKFENRKAQPSVIMVDYVSKGQIKTRLMEMDANIKRFLTRRTIRAKGSPFNMYYGRINDSIHKIVRGYPIPERTWVWQNLKYNLLPGGEVLSVSHFGSNSTAKAYKEIINYLKRNKMQQNGAAWEIELFNSKADKDSTLWETKIYFPIIRK